jgi:murein DD-endopeptidase MepM/ murein hydrolase activator NlpD
MKKILFVWLMLLGLAGCNNRHQRPESAPQLLVAHDSIPQQPVKKFLIFDLSRYHIQADTIKRDETFSKILLHHAVPASRIYSLLKRINSFWDIRKMRFKSPYFLVYTDSTTQDSLSKPVAFVYEESPVDYHIIYLDSINSYYPYQKFHKTVTEKDKTIALPIRSSLFGDLAKHNISAALALKLSDIYAWTVDFFHLQKGDGFKALYTDKYTDNRYLGVGKIKAAVFFYRGDTIYAFRYPTDSTKTHFDYFDEKGRSLRKQFLKSPLKFGRITSRYSLHRYVRIYGRVKPHLGTDFAAPVGTPIHATADGVIEKIGYTRGNGNYIKIRHNSTYATQYLHMSRFAKGMHKGVHVRQGDVIGYVGMTGFTTGPHVCYRFWKNGRQVDPFKQKLPDAKSLDSTQMDAYIRYITPLKQKLDSLRYEP